MRFFTKTLIFALNSLVLLPAVVLGDSEAHKSAEQNDDQTVLQIEVISQLHMPGNGVDSAYYHPDETFRRFEKVLTPLLEELPEKINFVIRRFPADFDASLPEFTIYIHDWKLQRSQQIEAVVGVTYKLNSERKKLGLFRGKVF